MGIDAISFDACRQRIYWSYNKANALIAKWQDFQSKHPAAIRFDHKGEGKVSAVIVHSFTEVPVEFSLELGEVLYHIRAALDGAVFCCAKQGAPNMLAKHEKAVKFPICDNPDDFNAVMKYIFGINADRKIILEAVQPYRTESCPSNLRCISFGWVFGILHKWAITDRHRCLHVIGSLIDPGDLSFFTTSERHTIENVCWFSSDKLQNERQIAEFDLIGPKEIVQMQMKGSPVFKIGIDEPPSPLCAGDDILLRLNTMFYGARTVIKALEDAR